VGRTDLAQQVLALALRAYDQINGSPDYPDGVRYEEWTFAGRATQTFCAYRRIFAFAGRMDCSVVSAQITLICTIADLLNAIPWPRRAAPL